MIKESKEDQWEKKQEALTAALRLLSLIANETYDSAMETKARTWLRDYRLCALL